MTDLIRVEISCGSPDEASRIAAALVEERLAACVQSWPMTSQYHWNGAIESASEIVLVAKTRASLFEALSRRVRGLHSYDNPEITAVQISHAAEDYARWVLAETAD